MNNKTRTSFTYAQTLLDAGQVNACLEELQRIPEERKSELAFLHLLLEALLRAGRTVELVAFLNKIDVQSAAHAALRDLYRAYIVFKAEDKELALRELSSIPECKVPSIDASVSFLRAVCEARLGRPAAAATAFRDAISLYERERNSLKLAECLSALGICERQQSHYRMANSCFDRARRLAQDAGSIGEEARASLNLGTTYLSLGQLIAAEGEFARSKALSSEAGHKSRVALADLGLGVAQCRRGRLKDAVDSLVSAKRNSGTRSARRTKGIVLEYLGEIRLVQGEPTKARRSFRRARLIGAALADPELEFEAQYRLAEAELALNNPDEARRLALESRDQFATKGDRLEAAFAARVAAQALLAKKNWKRAAQELTEIHRTLEELGEQFEIHRVRRLIDAAEARVAILDIRAEERVRFGVSGATSRGARRPGRSLQADEPEIVFGKSRTFLRFMELVDTRSRGEVTVLLEGETGVGKELIARRIHARGPRSSSPFVPFNCGTSSPHLFDTEIFGHVKGAFTGAEGSRKGLARIAHGGTLFLDEIGELTLESQARLLRLLDTGEVRPVGSDTIERTDLRLISATHRDLDELVAKSGFRRDLFYRLTSIRLRVPPLRERIEDLEILVHHFLGLAAKSGAGTVSGISDLVLEDMAKHRWPGNVRELKNEIFRLAGINDGAQIRSWKRHAVPVTEGPSVDALREALERAGGSVSSVARQLGISRASVYRLVDRHALDLSDFRERE